MSKKVLTIKTLDELKQILSFAAARIQQESGNSVVIRIDPLLDSLHSQKIKAAKEKLRKQNKFQGGPKAPFGTKKDDGTNILQKLPVADEVFNLIRIMRGQRSSFRSISKSIKEKYNLSISHEGIRQLFLTGKI